MAKNVKAKNTVQLLKEGASLDKKEVVVSFYPAYNKNFHSMLSDDLIATLKKGKQETFSIITESIEIIALTKSKDVKSITWA